ncbi:MAG: GTP-binding protein LepA, partial [Parcubacteria group bacterium Gr01-1014_66]
PSVIFRVHTKSGETLQISSATKMPSHQDIIQIEEPWAILELIAPVSTFGAISALIHERGGYIIETDSLAGERMQIRAEAPLREVVVDFYDVLKSISQGFASLSYKVVGWRGGELVRLDIRVAGESIPSFTEIVPKESAYHIGRRRVEKLKALMPRQLFALALQAEIEGRIIARETVPALRKDVTGYLYGGDRTRKMKLWKKQQRGKKRLKERAKIEIPATVMLQMLKR